MEWNPSVHLSVNNSFTRDDKEITTDFNPIRNMGRAYIWTISQTSPIMDEIYPE